MMQDMNITTATTSSTNQNNGFDTAVNGHEYLLSIIQLPIYLQLNLSKTKQLKNNVDGFPRRRQTVREGLSVIPAKKSSLFRLWEMVHLYSMLVQNRLQRINFRKINVVVNDVIHYRIQNQYVRVVFHHFHRRNRSSR